MGIESITDFGVQTRKGTLFFFAIQPTNLSVLPPEGVAERVNALLTAIKGTDELELLALNASESFDSNRDFYRTRRAQETLPALRRLLEQDERQLDSIQMLMASAREFYLAVRLRKGKDTELPTWLSRIEQGIRDSGFRVRRADGQAVRRMLALYFEQNVSITAFEEMDGARWMTEEEDA